MGWNHSCFLLQQAHLRLLCEDVAPAHLITRGGDPLLNRLRVCLYLDDITWFGPSAAVVDAAVARYVARCAARGWPVKLSKCQPAALRGVESLGCEIDGITGRVGVSPAKLLALVRSTQQLLAAGNATGRQLAALVGSWTWAALVRRPALALFGSVYRFIEAAKDRCFRLWPSVVTELLTLTRLAPLLFADLRATWFEQLVACDASEFALGVAATRASAAELEALWASRQPLLRDAPHHPHQQAGPAATVGVLPVGDAPLLSAVPPVSALPVRAGAWVSRPPLQRDAPHRPDNSQAGPAASPVGVATVMRPSSPALAAVSPAGVSPSDVGVGGGRGGQCRASAQQPRPTHSPGGGASPCPPASSGSVHRAFGNQFSGPQPVLSSTRATRIHCVSVAALPHRRWATIVAHRDGRDWDHITARELRAAGTAIRWTLSHPAAVNSRLLLLGDSTSALGALAKGRSSSFALRSILRPLTALLLASGLSLRLLYVPSAANPADWASRHPLTTWRPEANAF
jgi:hypothetical protein